VQDYGTGNANYVVDVYSKILEKGYTLFPTRESRLVRKCIGCVFSANKPKFAIFTTCSHIIGSGSVHAERQMSLTRWIFRYFREGDDYILSVWKGVGKKVKGILYENIQ